VQFGGEAHLVGVAVANEKLNAAWIILSQLQQQLGKANIANALVLRVAPVKKYGTDS
jgi:hypothetical protein